MELLCLAAFLTLLPPASGQASPNFTLVMAPFPPPAAIEPGGTDSSNLTLDTVGGFTGSVDLTCQVTSAATQMPVLTPGCQVSPGSVTPPGGASVTITTNQMVTPTGRYIVTVTGTAPGSPSLPPVSVQQDLSVLAAVPQFTITVKTPVSPTSIPAGNGATAVININPIFSYSSPAGGVTLACSSITPLVTIPPICSFSPQGVTVTPSAVATSTLTISTYGPVPTGAARGFSALWLSLPMLALVGLGAAAGGKRSRKACGLLALFVVSGAFLLMPACGTSPNSTSTPNGITPANSYTFTVVGVDAAGQASSNTGSSGSGSASTVTLSVTAPTAN